MIVADFHLDCRAAVVRQPCAGASPRLVRGLGRASGAASPASQSAKRLRFGRHRVALLPHHFRKLLARAGDAAKLGMPIHPHMLRHSTGFKLANDGQDTRAIQHYLGHKNIQHTVLYTQLAADRFNDFWKD